jgi:hypothetical protein
VIIASVWQEYLFIACASKRLQFRAELNLPTSSCERVEICPQKEDNSALPEAPLHPHDGLLLLSPFSMNVFDPLYFSCWARGATMVAAPPP